MSTTQPAAPQSPTPLRRKRDTRPLLGLGLLVAGALVWVLMFTNTLTTLFSGPSSVIKANFTSIEDIVPNDPVRINGVQVGTVASTTADPHAGYVTAILNLNGNAGTIHANASASIKWRTLLGANDVVDLDPGTPSAGPLTTAIPASRDSSQIELDEITRTLHGGAQQGLRMMLDQLGPALSDHPALGTLLGTLAKVAPETAQGVGAVRGEIPDTDLKNLIHDASDATQALDVGLQGDTTQALVQSAAQTFAALSASPSDLKATIADAAIVLPHITRTAEAVNSTLTRVDPLVRKLIPQTGSITDTLTTLHPTVIQADTLLHAATPLLNKLRPTVDSLAQTADAGTTVIKTLTPSLQRLDQTILPGLDMTSPESGGRTVYEAIGPVLIAFASLSAGYDRDGDFANLTLGAPNQNSDQLLPCATDFSHTDFLVCTSLSTTLSTLFGGGASLLAALHRVPSLSSLLTSQIAHAKQSLSQYLSAKTALLTRAPKVAQLLYSLHLGGNK